MCDFFLPEVDQVWVFFFQKQITKYIADDVTMTCFENCLLGIQRTALGNSQNNIQNGLTLVQTSII